MICDDPDDLAFLFEIAKNFRNVAKGDERFGITLVGKLAERAVAVKQNTADH